MKNILNFFYILFFLAFLPGCDIESKSTNEEICSPILQEILKLQNRRDIIREDFRITLIDYGEGKVSLNRLKKEKKQWTNKENRLATRTNELYEKAYSMGCL